MCTQKLTVQNNRVSIKFCQSYFARVVLQSVGAVKSAPCATGLSVLPRAPLVRLARRRRHFCLPSHARRRVCRPTVVIRLFCRLFIVPLTCSTRWTRCRSRSCSRSSLRGCVRRPTVLTTQRRRRYSRSFLTCFTRLTHASSVSSLAHHKWACPLSTFPSFKPHSSHTGPRTAPQLPKPVAVPSITPPSAFCPYILFRFERCFTVGFQPSRVTGLLARPYAGVSTDRPSKRRNDDVVTRTLRGFLLVSDVLYSLPPPFPLSRTAKWACPLSVRPQSPSCGFTSLVLISISTSLRLFFVCWSPALTFPEPQATFLSHRATYGATATNTSGSFTDHPSPAF